MLALVLAIGAVGGVVLGVARGLFDSPPWREQADRICLEQGNEYVSLMESGAALRRERLRISRTTLQRLERIRSDVPTREILAFNSLLVTKERAIELRVRIGAAHGGAVGRLTERLDGVDAGYQFEADQLGLNVCGQGTSRQ